MAVATSAHAAVAGILCLASLVSTANPSSSVYDWKASLEPASGEPLSFADYEGRATLMSFFFTRCHGACPLQARQLGRLQARLDDALRSKTAILSISLDPEHDTALAMQAFARTHAIDTTHWTLARITDPTSLHTVLDRVHLSVGTENANGQIDHRMTLVLVAPNGRIAQRYVADRFDVGRVSDDLATIVRLHEQGHLTAPGAPPEQSRPGLPNYLLTPHGSTAHD